MPYFILLQIRFSVFQQFYFNTFFPCNSIVFYAIKNFLIRRQLASPNCQRRPLAHKKLKALALGRSSTYRYRLSVCVPQIPGLEPHPRGDSIWRWGLFGGHESGALLDGISVLIRRYQGASSLSPPPRRQPSMSQEGGTHQTPALPPELWKICLLTNHPIYGIAKLR